MKVEVGGFYKLKPQAPSGWLTSPKTVVYIAEVLQITPISKIIGSQVRWTTYNLRGQKTESWAHMNYHYTFLKDFVKMVDCRVKQKEES